MILKGNLVTLRPVEYEDIEFIRGMINDPEMEAAIIGWAWPLSRKDQEKWYESFSNSDKVTRFIVESAEGEPIGLTGLRDIDWKNGTAVSAGMRIVSHMHSKGFATDAYKTFLNYAFNELRLHRVTECVFEENSASLRAIEKAGFKREGIQREAAYKGGRYHNVVMLGILASEFQP